MVGNFGVGGHHPIREQSMITSDICDTQAGGTEVLGLAEVGCEIVWITAQTKVYAANPEQSPFLRLAVRSPALSTAFTQKQFPSNV
jgi:4-hydroxy-3-methylbut-2-en-1-yl diphosphate synthase IspG/GcpE